MSGNKEKETNDRDDRENCNPMYTSTFTSIDEFICDIYVKIFL